MKKRILTVLAVLIIIAIIVGFIVIRNNNTSTNDENTIIKMNEVTRSVFYAPQYVAISNGYFKNYGIEIDLSTGQRS